jgi:hypothetical protein
MENLSAAEPNEPVARKNSPSVNPCFIPALCQWLYARVIHLRKLLVLQW